MSIDPKSPNVNDLFTQDDDDLARLPLAGAEVLYARRIPLPRDPAGIFGELVSSTPWRQESIVVYGKAYLQPRLVAWYGEPDAAYTYSGLRLAPLPWTPLLLSIKAAVEQTAKADFNSVLINFYRDHRDSVGFHSDDEAELGRRPVIASLSLGANRIFHFKPKSEDGVGSVKLALESGSLLVMRGQTQENWKHGVPKENKPCGPRINLTFRKIYCKGAAWTRQCMKQR